MSIQSVTALSPGVNSVTILGYGISARSTIDFLLEREPSIEIRVSELKARDCFAGIEDYEAKGVRFEFGQQTIDFILRDSVDSRFVMISPGIPPHAPVIKLIKDSQVDFGTDLDLFLDFAPGKKIAVTGTNGKTTTVSLLADIFDTQAIGNIGLPFMDFAKLKNQEVFVLEISSAQLFYSKLVKQVDCSVYLNFTDDHLDWHKDLAEYRLAKARLFEHDGVFILNQDDNVTASLKNDKSQLFSTEAQANAYYEDGALYLAESKLLDCAELQLVGKHNYSNILAASLGATEFGVKREDLETKLASFKAVPHRLEYITTVNGHKAYNDSKATNPDSAIKALESFDDCIAIIGGKDKNLDLREFIKIVSVRSSYIIIIGELRKKIAMALKNVAHADFSEAETLEQAVDLAIRHDSGLPIVLVPASSSFDMFKNYQERGDKFRQLIYTKSSGSCSI
jgi:UDP-N-acetylmuramoylalanine--D-glutamate ligase